MESPYPVQTPKPTSPKVVVGYIHPAEVSAFFMTSMLGMLGREKDRVISTIGILSGPKVDSARNKLFAHWLDETDADYLLMVDTDMVLPEDTLDILLKADKDIVGGLCFVAGTSAHVRPTIHVITEGDDGAPLISILWDYPQNTLVKVDATGGACILVKREVAEVIRQARGKDHPMPWFAHGIHNGVEIGEDIGFCLTAGKCGFEVWVDTSLKVGHVKPRIISEPEYVAALCQDTHPHYNQRDKVPVYQEAVHGQPSKLHDQSSSEKIPESRYG